MTPAMNTSASPALSVIIASYHAANVIPECLESLRRQDTSYPFEVIVVNSSADETPAIIAREFPGVRCLQFPERKYCGDARNEGIAVSRGPVIALTDADCIAAPDWVETILAAHRAPHPAIGGAIANANPGSRVGWAGYLLEFHHWLPASPPGWVDDMAGANLSYKREIFDRLGPFITGTYGSDTEFHWRLAAAGHRVWCDPAIRVYHRNIESPGRMLAHEFHHGRSFARVRVAGRRFSWPLCLIYAGAFPLIGLKLLLRCLRSAWAERETRAVLLPTLPALVAGHAAWSLGEAAGYLARRRLLPTPAAGHRPRYFSRNA